MTEQERTQLAQAIRKMSAEELSIVIDTLEQMYLEKQEQLKERLRGAQYVM